MFFTYDHRTLRIRLPVRSALYKQCTGGLVVRWVTTSESPLLYVMFFFLSHFQGHGWRLLLLMSRRKAVGNGARRKERDVGGAGAIIDKFPIQGKL
jgi:hypothetical protein